VKHPTQSKTRRAAHPAAAALVALGAAVATYPSHAEEPTTLDGLIRSYLEGRGASVQIAPDGELARRYALDVTGVIPSTSDLAATQGKTPAEMFDHFVGRAPMSHTGGERPYVWLNLLLDADHFLFSNSTQFSQVAHIVEFRDQLRRVYDEGWSYQSFARWALRSQMFLNRFPSAADRANAAFFLFLGRDSLAPEVQVGNMWNGYALLDPSIPTGDAEIEPNYHVHVFDPDRCQNGEAVCDATLWATTGADPDTAIELVVSSPLFAEAAVDRYWRRLVGTPLPGVEFPDVRKVLVMGLVAHDYDVNWLIREIATSAAYTQEMMFR
jgi:hypothetical protein